jgi:hypothetical protein
MWDMSEIRSSAITTLTTATMDPSERYLLAQKVDVEDWTVSSLVEHALRSEPMGYEDVEK